MVERFYSRRQLAQSLPFKDSDRFRVRIASLIHVTVEWIAKTSNRTTIKTYQAIDVATKIKLGINVEYRWNADNHVETWAKRADLADLLDFLTMIFDRVSRNKPEAGQLYVQNVNEIFREQNLAYFMDEAGGVHDQIDDEFSRNIANTLHQLSGERYQAVNSHINNALSELVPSRPNWRSAVREAFDACECLYRLMFSKTPNLKAKGLVDNLQPVIRQCYPDGGEACRAAVKAMEAFQDIVDGAHNYRHAKASEKEDHMPEELGILYFSGLLAFLRWLGHYDNILRAPVA